MTVEVSKEEEPKGGFVWTTVFEISPDAFLEVQRILDMLRSEKKTPTDPEIAKDEADDLYS